MPPTPPVLAWSPAAVQPHWAVAAVLAGYLLGSVPFGLIAGRVVRGVDVRDHGSGNLGATNVARVLGWPWFFLILALDAVKGYVPAAVLARAAAGAGDGAGAAGGPMAALGPLTPAELDRPEVLWLALGCGLAALLGHVFPLYLRFKGGKGVATALGVFLALSPGATGIALGCFAVVVASSRYISLGSLTAAPALLIGHLLLTDDPWGTRLPLTALMMIVMILVIVLHRGNIRRLMAGTESRIGDSKWKAEEAGSDDDPPAATGEDA